MKTNGLYCVIEREEGFVIVPALLGGYTLEEARRDAKALSESEYGHGRPVIDRSGKP